MHAEARLIASSSHSATRAAIEMPLRVARHGWGARIEMPRPWRRAISLQPLIRRRGRPARGKNAGSGRSRLRRVARSAVERGFVGFVQRELN